MVTRTADEEREPKFPQWTAEQSAVIQGGEVAVLQASVLGLTNEGFLEGRERKAGRCGWFFSDGVYEFELRGVLMGETSSL